MEWFLGRGWDGLSELEEDGREREIEARGARARYRKRESNFSYLCETIEGKFSGIVLILENRGGL